MKICKMYIYFESLLPELSVSDSRGTQLYRSLYFFYIQLLIKLNNIHNSEAIDKLKEERQAIWNHSWNHIFMSIII